MQRKTRWGRHLGLTTALASFTLVGGCALPVGVQVASWVADGISYVATNKSLTDHGISFMFGADCALHRLITEDGNICSPEDDAITTIVDVEGAGGIKASDSVSALTTSGDLIDAGAFQLAAADEPVKTSEEMASWAEFVTASGNSERVVASIDDSSLFDSETALPEGQLMTSGVVSDVPSTFQAVAVKTRIQPIIEFDTSIEPNASPVVFAMTARLPSARVVKPTIAHAIVADAQAPLAAFAKPEISVSFAAPTKRLRQGAALSAGNYIVIGSFHGPKNAEKFTRRHSGFGAQMVAVKTNAKSFYRVIVGPVARSTHADVEQKLAQAGLVDIWTVGISSKDVIVAIALEDSQMAARKQPVEVADISG